MTVLQNNNTKKLKTPYMCYFFTGDRQGRIDDLIFQQVVKFRSLVKYRKLFDVILT